MSNADYAFNWLVNRGYAPHQAAGIVGNLTQESNVQPSGVVGDHGTAFGIAQWRGPRLAGLQQFAKQNGQDWQSLDAQLGYLDHELKTTEKGAGDALRASPDVRAATRAVIGFERPQGYTAENPEAGHGWANRYGVAQTFVNAGAGQSAAPPQSTPQQAAIPGGAPYSPPTPQMAAPDDTMGSALALLAPEPGSVSEPLTPLVKPAQIGPFDGANEDVDVEAFQPRTTKRLRAPTRRA